MLKPRFNLLSLFLLTTVVALIISHVWTSLELHRVKSELSSVVDDLCIIDSQGTEDLYAVALPGNSHLQWKWRIQLPSKGKYRLRSFLGDVPANGFPPEASFHDEIFRDNTGRQLYNAKSTLLAARLYGRPNGKCELLIETPDRRLLIPIEDAPPWIAQFGLMTKVTQGLSPMHTVSGDPSKPLQLLRTRKAKNVAGGMAHDPNPTEGFLLWIERTPDQDPISN